MDLTTKYFLEIVTLIFVLYSLIPVFTFLGVIGWQHAFGQETKAPPAVTPTPVNTPTPTEPNPNLQYLPQKAYVQAYAPEVGLPTGQQPLQVVPQVVPAPAVQAGTLGIPGLDVMAISAAIGTFIRSELKGHTITNVIKKIAGTQVKQIEAQEEHLGLTMDQMPQKGDEITNKPNIKQDHIKEIKQEAIETAEKA